MTPAVAGRRGGPGWAGSWAAAAVSLTLAVLLALVVSACGDASSAPPTTSNSGDLVGAGNGSLEQVGYKTFAGAGPYAAGTESFSVRGDPVVVWYPAARSSVHGHPLASYRLSSWLPPAIRSLVPSSLPDRVVEAAYTGVPMAPGRFPIVLFSHGFGSYPEQSSFLTAHLASWGFIVVAPDQQGRDLSAVILSTVKHWKMSEDLREQTRALRFVEREGSRLHDLFTGHVLASSIGIIGHSEGGATAVDFAESNPTVRVVVAMAGVPVRRPLRYGLTALFMVGSADKVVPESVVRPFYQRVRGNKAFMVLDGAGHNVFDDVCTIAHSQGGVAVATEALHLPVPPALLALATDGCKPPDVWPPKMWPLIDQAVVAELRYGFGMDPSAAGLGPGLDHAFPGVSATYTAGSS